ncbi:MAG: hypothetical protein RMJ98_15220 [Myxococcales bacterium]|nr:hypothetical protein [Polyangiaceae bacterium]MDW8250644.1 hypothetical protein [Myxococcales bacterium]
MGAPYHIDNSSNYSAAVENRTGRAFGITNRYNPLTSHRARRSLKRPSTPSGRRKRPLRGRLRHRTNREGDYRIYRARRR